MDKIITYYGLQIENLSREKLIEAIQFAYDEIQSMRKEHNREREFLLSICRGGRSTLEV